MTRLVDDSGWIITGGVPTCGSACAWVSCSCTICRACRMSVPGSKIMSIVDSPVTDSERICSSHGTPLSRSCSSGTVISCSTSAADSPRASVWICTDGGVNCGYVSTRADRSWKTPKTSSPIAAAITRRANATLEPTIQRNMAAPRPRRTTPPQTGGETTIGTAYRRRLPARGRHLPRPGTAPARSRRRSGLRLGTRSPPRLQRELRRAFAKARRRGGADANVRLLRLDAASRRR